MNQESITVALQTPELTTAIETSRGWRRFAIALTLCLVCTLVVYASTARAMVEIWWRSETFAHGFVVLPITLWLIWRARSDLAQTTPAPAWWVLPLIAITVLGWLLGELAAVNAVTQLALVALLVLTVVAVIGTAAARKIVFPLAFLFFAVPIGEFMMGRLMEWTADVTVLGLRVSGIPVFREGQQFVIPTGRWSVVEACSGIRYLIASLMAGTIYAYLTYRSAKRRLIFVAASAIVPIVANWARAYIIVLLGHVSGNTLAAGVDHLIYGWLFFGVVISLLFIIGTRWREDEEPQLPRRAVMEPAPVARGRPWAIAGAVIALTVVWKLGFWAIERADASTQPTLSPVSVGSEWQPVAGSRLDWKPQFINAPAELHQTFRKNEQTVGLFIAYYRNQRYDSKLVTSENVMVTSQDLAWTQVGSGARAVAVLPGEQVTVRTASLRSAAGPRLVAWKWYWINGRLTANDHRAKVYTALSRLTGAGDDSAAVVVYALEGAAQSAELTLQGFLADAGGDIADVLRKTREAR